MLRSQIITLKRAIEKTGEREKKRDIFKTPRDFPLSSVSRQTNIINGEIIKLPAIKDMPNAKSFDAEWRVEIIKCLAGDSVFKKKKLTQRESLFA